MGIYVASGLGLLLTTSFLGLRRYLRQRKLQALEARPDLRRQVQRYGCARRCLSAEESAPYLKLPVGKELSGAGEHLELVVAAPFRRP